MRQPLAGIRVLDAGTRIAAPFCAGVLGEQGAEVLKIEDPHLGDKTRVNGPFTTDDNGNRYSLYWSVEGRGRKSVTINLREPEGQELFRSLASESDVVCENFRPGTLERWNIDPSQLNPRLVTARISLYGQQGPKSLHHGFDHNASAFSGLTHITGNPDQPPVRSGLPVSDYLTGVFAAQAVTSLLYERDAKGTGTGGVVDAYLYGSILRIMEWTIPAYDRLGIVRQRTGNQSDQAAPLDNFQSRDGRHLCIVAVRQEVFNNLCKAMNQPELPNDERFCSPSARRRNLQVVNQTVAEWASGLDAATIEDHCGRHGVPVSVVYDVSDVVADDHVRARQDLCIVDDPVIGPVRQQAPFPRFDDSLLPIPTGAPQLGEHTDEVLSSLLGLSETDLAGLKERNVI